MIAELSEVIDHVRDPAARPRLRRCLPFLRSAVDRIDTRATSGGLMIAAATANGAAVLSAADGWPQINSSTLKTGDVALALTAAIESQEMDEGDVIITGLTLLLGKTGLEAQALDAAQIVADGGQPLVVALIERERTSVTVLVTTIALNVHDGATVH